MAVMYPPETPYAQERVKWEAQHSDCGAPKRPYVKRDYPMMLHKAGRAKNGALDIVDTHIAESEVEARNLKSRGFCETPLEAIEHLHAMDTEIATLAAERNYVERGMSAKAQAEAAAADASTGSHVPVIPEKPKPRRGRPVKVTAGQE